MLKQKLKIIFCNTLCFFLAIILSSPVSALSADLLEFYATNNINYYNPSAVSSNCYSGDVSVTGSTTAEKIWSGLTTFMTPEQAAGVMGNMVGESGFNPVRHEESQKQKYWGTFDIITGTEHPYGIGLIQWSGGRRVNLLKYIQSVDSSLIQYFMNPDEYSVHKSGDDFLALVGDAVFDRLVQLELEFLKEEFNTSKSYRDLFNQQTVENATKYFMDYVERPSVSICYFQQKSEYCADGNPFSAQSKENYEKSLNYRTTTARGYYDALNGTSLTPSTGITGTNISGSNITIIGDSITEGSRSQIDSKLPGVEINAEVGRQFSTGIDIAKTMNLRSALVFALGTNSASLTSSQVQEILNIAGPSRTVYFITNYGTYDYTNNNQVFNEAASNNSNVKVIDWASSVASDPTKYIGSDGVHPTAEGKELFANLIYNAVTASNLTSDGCVVSGDLQSLVVRYAWPDYHPANFFDMMPDYAAAVQRRKSEGKYVGGKDHPGIDCGGFVTALVQDSGFAPDYNGYASNVPPQEQWVIENGWTLLNGSENSTIDTSILQPGDVAFEGKPSHAGHTFIYVGQIPGFNSNIASASYGGDSGLAWRTPMAGSESLTTGHGYPVRWYRKN